jgi:hypothetical protein
MELGGKSPALVLPGANLKIAANNVSPNPSDADDRSYLVLSSILGKSACRPNVSSFMNL